MSIITHEFWKQVFFGCERDRTREEKKGSTGDRVRKNGGFRRKKSSQQNKAYSRYFDGYTEYKDKTAGNRIKRVYTADYYARDESEKARIIRNIVYVALPLLAVVLFWVFGTRDNLTNRFIPTVIPQIICVIFSAWWLIAGARYALAGKYMTVGDNQRRTTQTCHSLVGVTAGYSLLALLMIIFFIPYHRWYSGAEVLSIFVDLAVAFASRCQYVYEKDTHYITVPNTNPVPEGGYTVKADKY